MTEELSLLGCANDIPFDVFMNICKATLDKVAPLKQGLKITKCRKIQINVMFL